MLLFLGVGLVLITAVTVLAQGNNLSLPSETTILKRNAGTSLSGSAGLAMNQKAHGSATQTSFNTGSATLAGTLTLLLLQRRNRNDRILKPKS